MTTEHDYYAILGVSKETSQDEIKKAYRKLARKFHPDVNPGDTAAEERFKRISEAYHVLGDQERRQQYDHKGPEAFAAEFDLSDFFTDFNSGFGGRGAGASFGVGGLGGLLGDLLAGQSPGGAGSRVRYGSAGPEPRGSKRGRNITLTVKLSLEEAVSGTEKSLEYRRPIACGTCGGGGSAGGRACPACGGSGSQPQRQRTRVRIPKGLSSGKKIRIKGKGEPGFGGPAGDLIVRIEVRLHEVFQLQGKHLQTEVPVAVYEAALGATVKVPTLDGSTKILLPPGTRNGQVFRLRGKGVEDGTESGDLLATIRIELPDRIDDSVAALMREFRERHPYDPRSVKDRSS